jgi:hypothetical protein
LQLAINIAVYFYIDLCCNSSSILGFSPLQHIVSAATGPVIYYSMHEKIYVDSFLWARSAAPFSKTASAQFQALCLKTALFQWNLADAVLENGGKTDRALPL